MAVANAKMTNENFIFRFSYLTFEIEKRKRNSFFVRNVENEKGKDKNRCGQIKCLAIIEVSVFNKGLRPCKIGFIKRAIE